MRIHIGDIVKKKLVKQNPNVDLDYHKLNFEKLVERFNTSLTKGLNELQATSLLIKNGKNVLRQKKKNVFGKIFNYLFTGFCALLWVSSLICFLAWKPIGDPPDPTNFGLGVLLIVVILLQAAFSAFQDWSSNKVMTSIKNMMPHFATVIRDGIEHKIPVEEVVIGDLVHLSYGNKVPADIRIIESHDLKFDKSMLTGESEAIEGTVECTDDRYVESKNIAYMTTLVTNGQGKGIVVAVGSQTIMGRIASLTNETSAKKTSLQKEISRYVYYVAFVASLTVVILVIIWVSLIRVKYPNYINTANMMVNSIAVFCAFVPTGLPVAVTLSLLLMARKMAKLRVLVKNLTTIETLSCVNVIASDKTGTLTQNKMFVSNSVAGIENFNQFVVQLNDNSSSNLNKKSCYDGKDTPAFKQLVALASLCNDATFTQDDENGNKLINKNKIPIFQRPANGDATDISLLKFSTQHLNGNENLIRDNFNILFDIPFNSKNKWMMKVVMMKDLNKYNKQFSAKDTEQSSLMLLKGAPDRLLKKCSHILQEDGIESELNDLIKLNIIKMQNEWCMLGQRVLLLCKKKLKQDETNELCLKGPSDIEKYVQESDDFCLVGMVGIIDPPREGISDVISKCRKAGIRVFMVTGDYALTAAAIAKDIGIFSNFNFDTAENMREKFKSMNLFTNQNNNQNHLNEENKNKSKNSTTSLLLNGSDIENLTLDDWRIVTKYDEIVFARTTPEQKLLIVKEFQRDSYTVGVTGDGVNDAPALKSADIGIAMGGGSEVAMEASQIVLLDNSFTSILVAIENGRLVFDNLRKVILYLIPTGSYSELIPILTNIFFGMPLALSAFYMIIICVLTDIFPALSMMVEKPEKNLLNRPPRTKKDHLVDWRLVLQGCIIVGSLEAFFSFLPFFWYLDWYANLKPRDVLFSFDKWADGYKGHSIEYLNEHIYRGQTIFFISLVIMQIMGSALTARTNYFSFFQRFPLLSKGKNKWILVAQLFSIVLMILIIFLPFCNQYFNTRPVPIEFFFVPFGFSLIILFIDEIRKLLVRNNVLCFPKLAW